MVRKRDHSVFPQFEAFSAHGRFVGSDQTLSGRNDTHHKSVRLVIFSKTFVSLSIVSAAIIGIFVVTVVRLQIFSHQSLLAEAQKNSSRTLVSTPPRGIILDRNGNLIAYNRPVFELYLDTTKVPSGLGLGEALNSFRIDGRVDASVPLLGGGERGKSVLVASDDAYAVGLEYLQLIQEHPEFSLVIEPQRVYPYGDSLSHIVGYVGLATEDEWAQIRQQDRYASPHEKVGKVGVEKQFDELLSGDRGVTTIEINAFGDAVRLVGEQQSGQQEQLRLSLDAEIQEVLYQALKQAVLVNGGTGGAGLISDVKTGEVFAMTSFPSFDNNVFVEGDDSHIESVLNDKRTPLFFRAISGEYPSGSIIKPVFALGALQEGIITPETTVRSTGGVEVGNFFFPDWKEGGHGVVDVYEAIAESVNTFFYYIGGGYSDFRGLGIEKLGKYARMFGLGSPSGIGLSSERNGFIPSPEWKERVKKDRWYIGDTYHFSIGQGDLLVTPIQMLEVIAAIANLGHMAKLHINGEAAPEISIPIDESHFRVIKRALRETVLSGSARSLSDLPIGVAGKTGTAEAGERKKPHAWFIGFVPYVNPRFAFVVLVENGGEGSIAAVPVARRIVEELNVRYLSK